MRILITGGNGMVARATTEHCRAAGDEVTALTRAEMDIADIVSVRRATKEHRPDAIINCAAYTNVDGAESEPRSAYAANVLGVENLASVACESDARFVTISTDYVFDGAKVGFYTQRDTPRPQGVYAVTKRQGEIAAIQANGRTVVVRTGWIYGDGGTNFLSVMHRLMAEGKTVKAIRDSYGTPTFAGDLAKRLRQLAELDLPAIYHITNSGQGTSYLGFAEKICEIGGYDQRLIEPVSKDDLKRPAPRPTSSKIACLFSERFGLEPMPDWEDGIRRFLGR
jgi:dTDP-4-dehydrorhamnose reductase